MNERHYPNPPENKFSPEEQARYLAGLVQAGFGLKMADKTINDVRYYLWRGGPENYEDLVASIFLECWQRHHEDEIPVTDEEVSRAANRVRQRLVRKSNRMTYMAAPEEGSSNALAPEDEVGVVLREFHAVLQRRSALNASLFQLYYLDGQKDVAALAEEMQISPATVYRKLKEIQDDFLSSRRAR